MREVMLIQFTKNPQKKYSFQKANKLSLLRLSDNHEQICGGTGNNIALG
jgi:hypothetical protein